MNNLFNAIQVAAGFTDDQMASALGLKPATYKQRRKRMCGEYRIKELKGLYEAAPTKAKPLILQAVEDFIIF